MPVDKALETAQAAAWWEHQRWRRLVRDRGHLEITKAGLRLLNDGARAEHYTDAQIDDYQGLARRDLSEHEIS